MFGTKNDIVYEPVPPGSRPYLIFGSHFYFTASLIVFGFLGILLENSCALFHVCDEKHDSYFFSILGAFCMAWGLRNIFYPAMLRFYREGIQFQNSGLVSWPRIACFESTWYAGSRGGYQIYDFDIRLRDDAPTRLHQRLLLKRESGTISLRLRGLDLKNRLDPKEQWTPQRLERFIRQCADAPDDAARLSLLASASKFR